MSNTLTLGKLQGVGIINPQPPQLNNIQNALTRVKLFQIFSHGSGWSRACGHKILGKIWILVTPSSKTIFTKVLNCTLIMAVAWWLGSSGWMMRTSFSFLNRVQMRGNGWWHGRSFWSILGKLFPSLSWWDDIWRISGNFIDIFEGFGRRFMVKGFSTRFLCQI